MNNVNDSGSQQPGQNRKIRIVTISVLALVVITVLIVAIPAIIRNTDHGAEVGATTQETASNLPAQKVSPNNLNGNVTKAAQDAAAKQAAQDAAAKQAAQDAAAKQAAQDAANKRTEQLNADLARIAEQGRLQKEVDRLTVELIKIDGQIAAVSGRVRQAEALGLTGTSTYQSDQAELQALQAQKDDLARQKVEAQAAYDAFVSATG